jgi:hypothetical protein
MGILMSIINDFATAKKWSEPRDYAKPEQDKKYKELWIWLNTVFKHDKRDENACLPPYARIAQPDLPICALVCCDLLALSMCEYSLRICKGSSFPKPTDWEKATDLAGFATKCWHEAVAVAPKTNWSRTIIQFVSGGAVEKYLKEQLLIDLKEEESPPLHALVESQEGEGGLDLRGLPYIPRWFEAFGHPRTEKNNIPWITSVDAIELYKNTGASNLSIKPLCVLTTLMPVENRIRLKEEVRRKDLLKEDISLLWIIKFVAEKEGCDRMSSKLRKQLTEKQRGQGRRGVKLGEILALFAKLIEEWDSEPEPKKQLGAALALRYWHPDVQKFVGHACLISGLVVKDNQILLNVFNPHPYVTTFAKETDGEKVEASMKASKCFWHAPFNPVEISFPQDADINSLADHMKNFYPAAYGCLAEDFAPVRSELDDSKSQVDLSAAVFYVSEVEFFEVFKQ